MTGDERNMKIVIAPDSFKESLSAAEVCRAIEVGFKEIFPQSEYIHVPMADGGEGTVESIVAATEGYIKYITVKGPLGKPTKAFYGISGNHKLAVIEMASSSGLDLVPESLRNPLKTTTWGFGELITDALGEGVEELILGIGGSATNDGGIGMAMSLGVKLLDDQGELIEPTGEGIEKLASIDLSGLNANLKKVKVRVACDVNNPLTGPNGASYIYGAQKGGTKEQIKILDRNLKHLAEVIRKDLNLDVEYISGAGAAGGLGAGLHAFLNATLEEGGKIIVDILNLAGKMEGADLVITGEGGINHQTIFGKTPITVSRVAKEKKIPVIALSGIISAGHEGIFEEGIDAVFSVLPRVSSKEEALSEGYENIKNTARNIAAVMNIKATVKKSLNKFLVKGG